MSEKNYQLTKSVDKLRTILPGLDLNQLQTILKVVQQEDVVVKVSSLSKFLSELEKLELYLIPEELIKTLNTSLNSAHSNLQGMAAQVSASLDIAGINKQSLTNQAIEFNKSITSAIIQYLNIQSVGKYFGDSSVDDIALATKASIITSKQNFEKWLDDLRSDFAKPAATAKYSGIFESESGNYHQSARWWLAATIFVILTTIVLSILLLLNFSEVAQDKETWQFAITKIIIATALFYSINMCLKSYRAQKHNAILNRHRHNALQTLEVFEKASTDAQTKNAILLEVTRTIFGNQQTGYANGPESDSDGFPKIIEYTKMSSK